ncbi:MAG: amidohydrolase family protein [Burkholderiales bacterium]|nr:amidohydrolase family protein [Burkholderiales bacterium]MCC7115942.1 amidohydrolase family protein [Burkholderiales bacterium]
MTAGATRAAPGFPPPAGSCDCHVHFYGDAALHPASADAGLPPQVGSATDYQATMNRAGIERVVAVQSILYGFDNRCMIEGMRKIGAGARGIAVVSELTPVDELRSLERAGVRGARAYMLPGGVLDWTRIPPLARRVAEVGWHVQVQLDGGNLPARAALLASLACPVVVDHVGKYLDPVDPDHPAFQALLRLIDTGRVWVKLSAPYESSRTGPPRYEDIFPLATALVRHAPERLLWASNWPHPGHESKPEYRALLELLAAWVPVAETRRRILVDNPAALYGYPECASGRTTHDERTCRGEPTYPQAP